MVAQVNYIGADVQMASEPEYTLLDHTIKSEEAVNFEQQLRARVIGQGTAVRALAQLYQV